MLLLFAQAEVAVGSSASPSLHSVKVSVIIGLAETCVTLCVYDWLVQCILVSHLKLLGCICIALMWHFPLSRWFNPDITVHSWQSML